MVDRRAAHIVIINDRSSRVGGASNLAILLAKMLEDRGIGTTYFAGDHPSDEKPVADTIHLGGTPLVDQGRLTAFANGIYNARAYAALRELVLKKDTPSTIYHVHGWSKILSPSIFRALEPVRRRTILHAHDYFLACPNGGFANYRSQQVCSLRPMSTQCLTTQCDKRGYHEKIWRTARHLLREHFYETRDMPANIVIVHERMRDYFARAGLSGACIDAIRNPVEPFMTEPGTPWRNKAFFFIGRLEQEKGFDDAARAARLAGAPLHVIGDGAGRAMLEMSFPEVTLHGWRDRDQIRALVGDARAVVVSSRVPEPFGLVALEAVSSGIPVVMPDSALLASEIAARGCGMTFRAGDGKSLANVLRLIATDDELVRAMSLRCAREASMLAQTQISWSEALMNLYERVLERAGRGALTGIC
ncbi:MULTISPECIES: glycosyltransferase family 4 protein [Alphaproteobacteria]|uniref:Polysaccharide biosynthesis protein n=2 Tax=Alphaproteobacteria TaxID=28211 RepID=A0A512HN74_9HYPH|nr:MULTISPECIES: glycosyltransferase family 4 protein [Alphaproteobacteria]GEO86879.1 polysaccharide biosynthesis protein [Ciceribacter naphthalenivorans]GLR24023.1 polysaccharide biosynthesis protein [Ciceribacter naphthalenivorans]GLT06879.1 polysaccharide biosynthesis protein [Sphingomonas psychrolutea]